MMVHVKYLILDTATPVGYIHYGQTRWLKDNLLHSDRLAEVTAELLGETPVTDLDFIAVGVGPGSYTGLRAAFAFAKGLALGAQIPLHGFCSLRAYRPVKEGSFAVVLDAKSGGVSLQLGVKEGEVVRYEGDPRALPFPEFEAMAPDFVSVMSPDLAPLKDRTAVAIAWEVADPDLSWIAAQVIGGEANVSTPYYLRTPI